MFNVKKITASGDAVLVNREIIKKIVLVGGSTVATLIIFSGATQAGGTDVGKIATVVGDTKELDYENGQIFSDGLSLTLSGTGAVAYIYY